MPTTGTPEGQVIALILALATLAAVDVISLGYRTDLMVRVLEGSEVVDHFGYVTVRTPANPDFWWGNFLLLPARAAQGEAGQWLSLFTAEFPAAAHVALGLDITGDTGTDLADFVAAGLDVQRETVLTAPALGAPPHPNRAALFPAAGRGRGLAAVGTAAGPVRRRGWPSGQPGLHRSQERRPARAGRGRPGGVVRRVRGR